ncbi:GerMN domain-containing protein [Micrococcus lylae]|uniref:GerMN domain-containing protein n=1 Tax=Micrococcus lylae TaxID=1273 RepID=UPI000C807E13|nr:GerMN domain-containing protein [Micrococcus lylae]WIK81468.1 GerMN domain-containing protein [Micrococcus lylae]
MHRTGRRPAARALAWAGSLALGTAALAGCTPADEEPTGDGSGSPSAAEQTGIPQVDRDGYQSLTVHLVAPVWSAPPGTSGVRVGCQDQDLLVAVQTAPTKAEDPADMAMDFLLQDTTGTHGEPALTNAVAASAKTLTYTGHRRDGDTEVFEFAGTVTVEDACDAERVRAQLEATAAANTDAGEVRVTVDGEDIADVLGLLPYEPGDEYTAPPEPEEPSETPAPGEGASSESAPGGGAPGGGAPSESAPGWTAPSEGTPSESAPGEGEPSLPGASPSYGVQTHPVVPPNGP